jgi:hypothetical protein
MWPYAVVTVRGQRIKQKERDDLSARISCGVPLQLFPIRPPVSELGLSVRELVAQGVLTQRELIDDRAFGSQARDRGIPGIETELLERWDRDGVLSPLAFVRGPWGNWRTTEPYPTDGIVFRDEGQFRPWEEYAYDDRWGHPHVGGGLYSEWQLLYAGLAREGETLDVPLETFLAGPPDAATFAANHEPFITQHVTFRNGMHEAWLPVIKLLLRLQARHWPYVHGRSVMLIDVQSDEHVDALDLEYERTSADDLRTELDLESEALEAAYRWLAERAQHLDPLPQLHDLRRLQPRDQRERERGAAREALDFYDAAELVRRTYRELTGELLPDADQLRYAGVRSRPLGRDRDQLRAALRHQRLYPHRLHMVVEGETEVLLVTRLFEAFSGRAWEGAGLAMTDLGGDKLEGSRTMLEGFSVYADAVALLLDDENDARRVTRRLSEDGVLAAEHVQLWDRSLEEDNFTPEELLSMVTAIGAGHGASLLLDAGTLLEAQESRNQGGGRRKGLASVLEELARRPEHGAVVFSKPQLAIRMADLLLEEIRAAPGHHEEVAQRRPIVRWVMEYPLRSHHSS